MLSNNLHKQNQTPLFTALVILSIAFASFVSSKPCPPQDRYNNCKLCDLEDNCSTCNDGYYINPDPSEVALSDKKLKPLCLRCPTGCKECTEDECTSCEQGFFIHRKTADKRRSCGECSEYCKDCKKSANQCTSCFQGYELNEDS